MDSFELLRELMEIPGPTGQEERVMAWLRERWAPRTKRIWTSKVGNLLAHVGGEGPILLIQGHADEISFLVKSIDANGFLWLASGQAGTADPTKRYPVGQPALVLGRREPVEGVFATVTGHILNAAQRNRDSLEFDDLFVDIGASSRDEVLERGIHVGAGVIWNPAVRRLGTRIYGKAIDDRISLAIMTMMLEQVDPADLRYDVYFAATVQEEIGLAGAMSLRADVDADLAIALDNGLVGDIPTVSERDMPTVLGGGPTLVHKDHLVHYDYNLIWRLADLAEREGIPVQHAVYQQFSSDGATLLRQGIPTALIAPATRYTHSAFEMIDERDVDSTLALVKAFVTTAP
ncbi:MAG TPA: M20/M25/M40 family metallo-hydrolase [Nitrolancea sp.]|jgi:endoglucanase|nr:M20/M25/M40 family metallo-hydrolase [Nitrolancea sp.]